MRRARQIAALLLAASLCACAGKAGKGTPDTAPTLKILAGREISPAPGPGVPADEAKAIAAYRRFLDTAPQAPQRAEALRRVGDLEMDRADTRSTAAESAAAPDYRAAIARYNEFLNAYPQDPGNDRVLYQLARAQEQGGQLETALKTLDRLVAEYPQTASRDEAQFRRGELLFTTRDYVRAEAAFTQVLSGAKDNPYRDRALYMQGWSRFKQGRLEDALAAFFGVLDAKLVDVESLSELPRGERELVEDTLRVTSLSLASLDGARSIAPLVTTAERRAYEFRIYQHLGELYIRQDRTKDAADTFGAFVRREPLHAQAPVLQARVVAIYAQGGFALLALEAKKDYVTRYGVDSDFRRANDKAWERAQPLVKTYLAELTRHHHALAQASKRKPDYAQAVDWYRLYLRSFPADADAAQSNFLLAELLFEDRRYAEAAVEYEQTAYELPQHARGADAGYAALLCYAALEKTAGAEQAPALQRTGVASALRFADAYAADPRVAPVLTHAAERLYALQAADEAAAVAERVLGLAPPPTAEQRRVAWTVIAHAAFESERFDAAERAYAEAIALAPEAARKDLVERLAASVYKQGARARDQGQGRDAAAHFARVGTVAPQSAVRATAQYDAAAALMGVQDWGAATATLEDFRRRYPGHALQGEATDKLALAYLERKQWALAAAEFERIAARPNPEQARAALWQAAELYEKAGSRPAAAKAYELYLTRFAQPLEPALEARWRLATLHEADTARRLALLQQIQQTDQAGGTQRSARTRYLGASAALALAEPAFEQYRKVALVEPLAKQLKLKKSRLEDTLKAYAVAAEYGVAEVTTAATFHTAALYQDFGRALLESQRPAKLSKPELEQYNVLLEEQAFPFEEKAIELHELNARRATQGLYDRWVQASFAALRELRPVRYAKSERSEGVIDAIR